MNALLPDAFAKAAGRILADLHTEWRKDLERINAESRATIAELRATIGALEAQAKEHAEQERARVSEAIASIKNGEPGPVGMAGERGADGRDGTDGKDGSPGERGHDGKDGRDSIGLAGGMIDRDGNLVLTLTDGSTRQLGIVVGKDGEPGRDGMNGKDGRDGLGFENLEVTHDSERGFELRFVNGEHVKSFAFSLPVMIYRGVYREDAGYVRGDTVTFGGSLWHCDGEPEGKPGDAKGWTLCTKRGRDGKDGIVKAETPKEPIRVG